MTGQQTLDGGPARDPLNAGIHHRLIDGFFLRTTTWHHANHRREIVGTCRQPGCGGLLQPIDTHSSTHEGTEITWYAAHCLNCGHEVVAPNGRILARSSRRGEMPDGWWQRRTNALAALKEAAKRQHEKEAA